MSLYKGPSLPPEFWENLRATMTRNQEAQWAANRAARLQPVAAPPVFTPTQPAPPPTAEQIAQAEENDRRRREWDEIEEPAVEMDGPDYRYPVTRYF